LAYGSLVIYLLSLFVPVCDGTKCEFGFELMLISTISILTLDLFHTYLGGWASVAIALGGVANLAFVIGYLSLLVGIKRRGARRFAGWCAALSVVAALATVPALSLDSQVSSPVFPTFCLWLASPWALWLGTLGMRTPAADSSGGGTLRERA